MESHQRKIALPEFEPDCLDLIDHELQRHDADTWLRQMELRRLLEHVHRVCAGGAKRDHRRIALLRLEQERAEIGGAERSSHAADDRAAEFRQRRDAITLKRMPEGE